MRQRLDRMPIIRGTGKNKIHELFRDRHNVLSKTELKLSHVLDIDDDRFKFATIISIRVK